MKQTNISFRYSHPEGFSVLEKALTGFLILLSSLLLAPMQFASAEDVAAEVTELILIDAKSDADIGELKDGANIALSELPSRQLNVRAEVKGVVQKIRFQLNTHKRFREETAAPYSLAGDVSGDYRAWKPRIGENVIVATPLIKGKEGKPYRVRFLVSESKMLSANESTANESAANESIRNESTEPPLQERAEARARMKEDVAAVPEPQASSVEILPKAALKEEGEEPAIPEADQESVQVNPKVEEEIVEKPREASISPPSGTKPLKATSPVSGINVRGNRQVFFLEAVDSVEPRDAIARGECTVIEESDSLSLKIVCTHTLEQPLAVDLRQSLTGQASKQVCSLGAPQSPVVGDCALNESQRKLLQAGKLYVAISTGQGGLRGWLPSN